MTHLETFESALIRFLAIPRVLVAVLDLDLPSGFDPSTVIVFRAEANFEAGSESLFSVATSSSGLS